MGLITLEQIDNKLRSSKGQSLIIALSVMFIMVFLGGLFVTLISRNLQNAVRSGDVLTARQMAEAGIRYADKMLTYSEDGADWRPVPDDLDPAVYSAHPDIRWLQPYDPIDAPTGGFTSFTSGSGRFLLRVSYTPSRGDSMSRYIKIESVGRSGFVESNFMGSGSPDPTTLAGSGPIRLRQELTAYKPIGITDYARFITNKEKRTEPLSFGRAPNPTRMVFGGRVAGQERYGPLRVNGNLLWRGEVDIFLDGKTYDGGVLPVSGVEVAGDITHDINTNVRLFLTIDGSMDKQTAWPTRNATSDLDPDFSTFYGFYRDGLETPERADMSGNDPLHQGLPRAIKRLEPPLVDQEDPSSGTTRYRRLTLLSGVGALLNGRYVDSGRYGHGRGIYIDNSRDTQSEGSSIFGGGPTLRAEWMHPNNKGNWHGSHYVPPGVVIRINPDATLTITRTDVRTGRRSGGAIWTSYNNTTSPPRLRFEPGWGPTATFAYPENGVVFAEGNIRISGVVAKDKQLTIVSDQSIYIEGSILKDDQDTSAIALLARKYIVVNTTQFFNLPPLSSATWESVVGGGQPPFAHRVTTSPTSNFQTNMTFGYWFPAAASGLLTAADYPSWSGSGKKVHLFLRHASAGASAVMSLFLNGVPYNFGPTPFYLMDDASTQFAPTFEGRVFGMDLGLSGATLNPAPGFTNSLQIALCQTGLVHSRGDYQLESMAVVPMDVNIQALCYAEEGSFFVIPGPWFNTNPEDTPEREQQTGSRPAYIKNPEFPYYGEPLDIKITVDGAISENLPAADGDVAEWMQHWGNIPKTYGSSSQATIHPQEGITFLYDPHLGYPVLPNGKPFRVEADPYRGPGGAGSRGEHRPLPATPKLPVSPDLIYVGRMSS